MSKGNRGYRAAQLEGGITGGRLYLGGYAQRFGLAWVDFDDPKRPRALKQSGLWYGQVAAENGFET